MDITKVEGKPLPQPIAKAFRLAVARFLICLESGKGVSGLTGVKLCFLALEVVTIRVKQMGSIC